MSVTIKAAPSDEAIELDVKRFYIPGVVLSSKCPQCKKTSKCDLGADYLSYPSANVPIDQHFYCAACEREWDEKIVLRVTVEAAK